jgi:glycosyltransferase involved in cell wall biosynthesis
MSTIIIIGPGHPLRGGGLTTFNHRLAREFIHWGHACSICSFSLQYPSLFFPGKSQYSKEPPPEGIVIRSLINSINPFNWLRVGNKLRNERPDIVVVRYWIPFMGPALGTILRRIRKNRHTKIICLADNVIPHEHRPGDKTFTRYFLKSCDAFITMSENVMSDLRSFEKNKPAMLVPHPLYDNFGTAVSKAEAREKLGLGKNEKIILFFGFIRNYKGLDLLLEAMSLLKNNPKSEIANLKLLVAGEFYEDKSRYLELIDRLDIKEQLVLKTDFIPDADVRYYLCAADAVIQPYRNATQSGVTPLAYHFERPMVVTDVGGLAAMVPHEKAGLVAQPTPQSIAEAILRFYQLGESYFIPHLRTEKQKYSWGNLMNAVTKLAEGITGRTRE